LATLSYSVFFCFTDPAPPALYTLSLHDALPICAALKLDAKQASCKAARGAITRYARWPTQAITYRLGREQIFALRERAQRELGRSEEHTSELQSLAYLVCRLLLEKKKKKTIKHI